MKKNSEKLAEKGRKFVKILGINVLVTRLDRVITRVNFFISHNVRFYIVTPNPELVLMSQKNVELKKSLNNAEFAIPDGIGLDYASRFLYGKPLNIIPGRKLFLELIKLAYRHNWNVFLLGGMGREAALTASKLKSQNSNLKIDYDSGPKLNQSAEPVTQVDKKLQKDVIDKINKFTPDLLFVAFGNPKQEIWIHKNLSKLKIGGAMAVGGTFRYIAGLSKLPPKWMERFGLEWVYRLITEPYRIGRIFNAFPVFPLKVFWYKVSGR